MTTLSLFNRNVLLLTALSLLWAWQVMLASSFILNQYPASSSLSSQVFPEWRYLLQPEWKPLIFHLVVAAAIIFQMALLWFNRHGLNTKDLLKKWQAYLTVETLLTFLWTSAAFKMIVYANRPALAEDAFVVLLMAVLLCKGFCTGWQQGFERFWAFCLYLQKDRFWRRIIEWSVPVLLFILIYVPNLDGVIAREFIGEQFHHMDGSMMAPAWGYVAGQTLDVDIISEYGIGIIAVLSRLTQIFGGFSYEHLLGVTIVATIVYYIGWYLLIRRWLGSLLLASAMILLGIKWQMFHWGVYPFVFTYTSATPLRFFYDVVYFWCLWMHINSGKKNWLIGAAAACGFGIYYMTSEGFYGTASFIAYIVLLLSMPAWRRHFGMRLRDGFLLFIPFAVAMVLLAVTIGPKIVSAQFWGNIGEFINYFLSGFGLEHMYKTLLDHKYLESLMGFVIPMVYLLTLLILLGRLAVGAAEAQEWFVVVLCFYGMSTFHYYVERSTGTSYYAVCLPYVFVLAFWIRIFINSLKENRRALMRLGLFITAVWALLTNHMFLSYPNMVNLSSHPLTDKTVVIPLPADGESYFNHLFRNFNPALKLSVNSLGSTDEEILDENNFKNDADLIDYYHKQGDFSRDAALIDSFTAPSDEVPLISGFETKILMQADRKTFFYYYPLLISRPMKMRSFEVCSIYTTDQLAKTIDKFEKARPPYVFMERIYLVNEVPRTFLFEYPSLIPLINYVRTHYAVAAQGEYLVALKRIRNVNE